MPDWWEQKYFGGITAGDSVAMAPNGTHSYLETYIAGLGLEERFEIEMDSALSWSGQQGRKYSVYMSTNLIDGFTEVQTNIPWSLAEFPIPETNSTAFFQVAVELDNWRLMEGVNPSEQQVNSCCPMGDH